MKALGTTLAALFLAVATTSEVRAENSLPVSDAEVKLYRIEELVRMIESLGQGKLDEAIKQLETLQEKQLSKEKGPFTEASRWAAALNPFENGTGGFESADVIGIQSVSTHAKLVTIVAISEKGPVLFAFGMYKFGTKYRIGNLSFQSDWNRFPLIVGIIKERRARVFKYAIQSAAKDTKTATK